MKLRIDNKVYLQRYEVAFLMHNLGSVPYHLIQEIFGEDGNAFLMNNRVDGFRFDCVFEDAVNVEWLMEQDWILDYEEHASMSVDELRDQIECSEAERFDGIDRFNSKSLDYRKRHFEEESERFSKLSHKVSSLEELIAARKGRINFVFPDGYHSNNSPHDIKRPSFISWLFSRDGAQ